MPARQKDAEAERDKGSDVEQIKLDEVKRVLQSRLWWVKLDIYHMLSDCIQALRVRFKRCPCHPTEEAVQTSSVSAVYSGQSGKHAPLSVHGLHCAMAGYGRLANICGQCSAKP